VRDGPDWRFPLPDDGIEPMLGRLLAAGAGILNLSIERPSLHEAFVRIVGESVEEKAA